MILAKMKEITMMHIGSTIKDTVLTFPANFNDPQGQATKNAYYTKFLVSLIALMLRNH